MFILLTQQRKLKLRQRKVLHSRSIRFRHWKPELKCVLLLHNMPIQIRDIATLFAVTRTSHALFRLKCSGRRVATLITLYVEPNLSITSLHSLTPCSLLRL